MQTAVSRSALIAGDEQLHPAEWLQQKRGMRPHLLQYHLLPKTVSMAQVMQFGWLSYPGMLSNKLSWHVGKITVV